MQLNLTTTDAVRYSASKCIRTRVAAGMHPRQSDAFFSPNGFTAMGAVEQEHKTRKGNTARLCRYRFLTLAPTISLKNEVVDLSSLSGELPHDAIRPWRSRANPIPYPQCRACRMKLPRKDSKPYAVLLAILDQGAMTAEDVAKTLSSDMPRSEVLRQLQELRGNLMLEQVDAKYRLSRRVREAFCKQNKPLDTFIPQMALPRQINVFKCLAFNLTAFSRNGVVSL